MSSRKVESTPFYHHYLQGSKLSRWNYGQLFSDAELCLSALVVARSAWHKRNTSLNKGGHKQQTDTGYACMPLVIHNTIRSHGIGRFKDISSVTAQVQKNLCFETTCNLGYEFQRPTLPH